MEDTSTLVVNLHGAKIRLARQLLAEEEIRIVSRTTELEAIFRVVSKAGEAVGQHTHWGIECLDPSQNIWGIVFPCLGPRDQTSVRAMLECPTCHAREVLHLDEPLLESIVDLGGLLRGCLYCRKMGLWTSVRAQQWLEPAMSRRSTVG